MKFHLFDAATAALQQGVNVVEASAGTGKTYSIAMLVLRFVVEMDVAVEELLVVTYTRAATEELRGRIRKRLVEARDLLLHGTGEDTDPGLKQYLKNLPDSVITLSRLQKAILDMDQAPVFTIHGFCQRMLQEQALESGQLFDMELCADVGRLRLELVEDFWRSRMYGLPPLHCAVLMEQCGDPQALYKSVREVGPEDRIEPRLGISLKDALAVLDENFEMLQSWWSVNSESLEELFLAAVAEKMFKKKLLDGFVDWWQQCALLFSETSRVILPDLLWLSRDALLDELSGTRLRGEKKKKAFLDRWPLPGQTLDDFLDACAQAVLCLRLELAAELQKGVRKRLQQRGLFSFDDLILLLAEALEGPWKTALQPVLAKRFKVALIDEFQDTDAAQYRIFSKLFGEGKHYLYLIGDPKQAIYKFRGADIYAYFEARKAADNSFTLARNYRSNPLLVEAVNDLFMLRSRSFVNAELPYHPVDAAMSPEMQRLLEHGTPQAAMVYCSIDSPDGAENSRWTSTSCLERLQTFVLDEIRDLLEHKTLTVSEGVERPLAAGDIAVLVRSHRQAEAFQQTFAQGGIPSVLSGRKTVFKSDECPDLLVVLDAVAAPFDTGLLCRALSCKWFAYDGPALHALIRNEEETASWQERFYGYHQLWQKKGILAMMNTLTAAESVFETLCTLPLAQRQIANIIHLLEILQEEEAAAKLPPSGLLYFLRQQRESDETAEHAQLRLESDEEAVKIVTMHGVKGLEFPVVFCPVLWGRSARMGNEKQCIRFHDEQNRLLADLGSAFFEERRDAAVREELAEELRLLYVAVTRGSCRSYVCWADVKSSRWTMSSTDSALGWVLSMADCDGLEEQNLRIQQLCDGEKAEFRLLPALPSNELCPKGSAVVEKEYSCCQFSGFPLTAEWLMTSYSALVGEMHHSAVSTVSPPDKMLEVSVPELPSGAGFGNVVHGVLEDYPFSMLAGSEEYTEAVEGQCRRFGVTADAQQLILLLKNVTRSQLFPDESDCVFRLADLSENDLIKEMPFYFHLRRNSTERINALLAFSDVVRPVQEKMLQGYLTGFVDLLCRHRGKYYVIDYKSNNLGDALHDYNQEQLKYAMASHNYGLQYWIYSMVLHRFLKGTLVDYSYEMMFGGVFYLFARGMHPHFPGNGVFYDRPQQDVLEALLQTLAGKGDIDGE